MFSDPWNPSSSEVRAWAYDPEALEPCQDWDLALSWAGHEHDYFEFAADQSCPNQAFFLHVLYLMVGDSVRSGFQSTPEHIVRGFIGLGENHINRGVSLWHERSLRLLRNPAEFEYGAWCGGGLARNDA
jgi:hypothetical protein